MWSDHRTGRRGERLRSAVHRETPDWHSRRCERGAQYRSLPPVLSTASGRIDTPQPASLADARLANQRDRRTPPQAKNSSDRWSGQVITDRLGWGATRPVDYRRLSTRRQRLQGNSPRVASTPHEDYVPRTGHPTRHRRQNAVSETSTSGDSENARGDRQCAAALGRQEFLQWTAPRVAPAHAHFDRFRHSSVVGSFTTHGPDAPGPPDEWGWHQGTTRRREANRAAAEAHSDGVQSGTSIHSMPPPDITLDDSTSNQNSIRRTRLERAAANFQVDLTQPVDATRL